MAHCPLCQTILEKCWKRDCPTCNAALIYCFSCETFSEVNFIQSNETPEVYAICTICKNKIDESAYVAKSSIYNSYRYAFKFINKIHVPYPLYFESNCLPFGSIEKDLGYVVNDFGYDGPVNKKYFNYKKIYDIKYQWGNNDGGTSRAYRVNIEDDENVLTQGIALSHESGLEVFLIAASAFVGVEVAKYSLKRILETIELRINNYWIKRKDKHWDKKNSSKIKVLVDRIAVRTPYWEITIDGIFSQNDRERILDHISANLIPKETIEEFTESFDDKTLRIKILKNSRQVYRHV